MARVLVVDDDSSVREVTRLILQRAGHEVITAANGLEALEQLGIAVADMVLLDIEMPGMNGLELCERMRAEPSWQAVPVIMMTGRPVQGVPEKVRASGAVALLLKPFDRTTLLDKVKQVLSGTARDC